MGQHEMSLPLSLFLVRHDLLMCYLYNNRRMSGALNVQISNVVLNKKILKYMRQILQITPVILAGPLGRLKTPGFGPECLDLLC